MLFDKLNHINDQNRLQALKTLTPEELSKAKSNDWAKIFQELATVNNSDISAREKRELLRQIYPHYKLSDSEKFKMQAEAYQVFDDLMKRPDFLHSVHRWQNGPKEERPKIMQTVAGALKDIVPGAHHTRIETFNEDSRVRGFAREGDTGDIIHVNINPKVFEQKSLQDVVGTLYHELTHKVQERQLQDRPELKAPYISSCPSPTVKAALEKEGYRFTEQDEEAYRHHPAEMEAYLKGTEISELLQEELGKGLGKGLLKNPYQAEAEEVKFQQNQSVKLGGVSENTNPYQHLFAGISEAKKILNPKPFLDAGRAVGDCLNHFRAVISYGEFLENSPAKEMLSLLSHYMKQPTFDKALAASGYKHVPQQIFDKCAISPNPELRAKATLLTRLQRIDSQQWTDQSPLDNHNAIDIREAFKDRKPIEEAKNPLETERQQKRDEVRQRLGLENQLNRRRGMGL